MIRFFFRKIAARIFYCTSVAILFYSGMSKAQYAGQHKNEINVPVVVPIKALSFDLRDVRLLDSRFKENMERDEKWLPGQENSRLLLGFRVNAGTPITSWIKRTTKPLTFELTAVPGSKTITLIPFYRIHRQRYVVYCNLN